MTPDEVQRALHGEAKNQILPEFARDKWNLNIANVKIQADNDVLNMDVHFLFDKSEKFSGVTCPRSICIRNRAGSNNLFTAAHPGSVRAAQSIVAAGNTPS